MEDYYAATVVMWCGLVWLPAVVVGRRWFVFSACLVLCHVEYLVWWCG